MDLSFAPAKDLECARKSLNNRPFDLLQKSTAGAIIGTNEENCLASVSATRTMVLATEYKLTDEVSIPMMQSAFKQHVEDLSKGQLHVDLRPQGELGLGGALASRVATGGVHAAQFSLANLSSYVPAIDVINIPYWCGDNQRYANLVTSDAWARAIDPQLAARGFKVLFYYTEDPRTIATSRMAPAAVVRTPEDLQRIRMRVPNSKAMTALYRLAGAEPVVIPWAETQSALQRNQADALDPAVATLYTTGFSKLLRSISYIDAVADGQVYACNLHWYRSLPRELQTALDEASERAMVESFTQVPLCRAYSLAQMEKAGVQSYKPSAGELQRWTDAIGEHRSEWDQFKIELLESLDAFDTLKAAANTRGRYSVSDY